MLKATIQNLLRGFAMGTTDLIPGFSGSTTALLLGIYERLITFISGAGKAIIRRQSFKELDWKFAIPLVIGIFIAVFSLASLLRILLKDYPEEMAGVFSGLTIFALYSLLEPFRREKSFLYLISLAIGGLFFWLLGFGLDAVETPNLLIFFLAGVLASIALILPGVSGSFILLILGLYSPVINAVSDFEILDLILLGLGAAVGLVLFSSILNFFLKKYRTYLLAIVSGLLLGSFRVLWPWPDGVGIIDSDAKTNVIGTKLSSPSLGDLWLPLVLGSLGFLVSLLIHLKVKKKLSSMEVSNVN